MNIHNATIDELTQILWDYNNLNQPLEPADAIFVLGSNDIRVAEYGASLWLEKYAPLIVFSGNAGKLTTGVFSKPEAEVFADIAEKMGVPRSQMIIENESTNTGENILFVRKLLQEKSISVRKAIIVQKPYMGRRTFATVKKQWPELNVIITAPKISYGQYPNEEITKIHIINTIVGDTQRIREYPKLGFQIAQEILDEVWSAYEELVHRGFTQHLIK